MQKNILIIGYGDIAKRLIKVIGTESINISAISRNDSNNPNINKFNWDWLSDKKIDLKAKNFDSAIIIPKPSSLDEKGYKDGFIIATKNILNLLSNLNINKVIAISSTRVYGGHHKGAVDEKSIEKPSEFRGKLILEYEKTFMPFLLLSKKRYVGMLHEFDINKAKTSYDKINGGVVGGSFGTGVRRRWTAVGRACWLHQV